MMLIQMQPAYTEFEEIKLRFSESEIFIQIIAYIDIPILLFLIFGILFAKKDCIFYIFALIYSLLCAVKIYALIGYSYMLGDFSFIIEKFATVVPFMLVADVVLFVISIYKILMFIKNRK